MQSLAKFTLLTAKGGLSEMRPKNVETIKTLITVANTEGNVLQESWQDVLRVVSHLELAQLVTAGSKPRSGSASSASSTPISQETSNTDIVEGEPIF